MRTPGQGTIISFYSFKGGVGTSTTVANTAWLLASAGKRVAVVDWDLRAPSLHRFFRPFLTDPELVSTEGLLEAALAFSQPVSVIQRIQSFVVSVDWDFPNQGALDLLPAGRQDPGYATRASSFAWQPFFDSPGGSSFVQALREELRRDYEYVLIDTSSGIRDAGSVDTVILPDSLCLCYALNRVMVSGCQQLAETATRVRAMDPIRIFPLAMRVDQAEKQLLDEQRAMARSAFASFLGHIGTPEEQQQYWRDVEFSYVPFHSYGEVLPVFMDREGDMLSLSAANERLCRYFTDGAVTSTTYPPESTREDVLARYRASS
jgi:cellulose biosynthesis protein BcsQ